MSAARTPADQCPRCAARVRATDPWCTLCHASLGPTRARPDLAPDLAPDVAPDVQGRHRRVGAVPAPAVPHQRSAQERPATQAVAGDRARGPLVGGRLPDDVLARVEAGLAGLAGDDDPVGDGALAGWAGRLRGRPALAATVGGIAVLLALLVAMTVLGLVI